MNINLSCNLFKKNYLNFKNPKNVKTHSKVSKNPEKSLKKFDTNFSINSTLRRKVKKRERERAIQAIVSESKVVYLKFWKYLSKYKRIKRENEDTF